LNSAFVWEKKYTKKSQKIASLSLPEHPNLVHRLLEFLYEREYSKVPITGLEDVSVLPQDDFVDLSSDNEGMKSVQDTGPRLVGENGDFKVCILHALMYDLAVRYNVDGLKVYSLEKFGDSCNANVKDTLDPDVIDWVFVKTDHESLQEAAVRIICERAGSLDSDDDLQALKGSYRFAQQIAHTLLKQGMFVNSLIITKLTMTSFLSSDAENKLGRF
jgi:hypothetical protein